MVLRSDQVPRTEKLKSKSFETTTERPFQNPEDVRAATMNLLPCKPDDFNIVADIRHVLEQMRDEEDWADIEEMRNDEWQRIIRRSVSGTPKHKLREMLSDLKADDLRERTRLFRNIRSNGLRKQEMIDALFAEIISKQFMQEYLMLYEDEELDFLQRVIEANELCLSGDDAVAAYNLYLRSRYIMGFYRAGNNRLIFVVPDEVVATFKETYTKDLAEKRAHSHKLDQYAATAVSLYGIVKTEDFIKLYNTYNEDQTNDDDLSRVLINHILRKNTEYALWEDCLAYHEFEDDDFEYAEYLRTQHEKFPVRQLSNDMFIQLSDPDYYQTMKENKLLYAYLREYHPESKEQPLEALFILRDFHDLAARGLDEDDLPEFLESHNLIFDLEKSNELISLMMDVYYNMRSWSFNGWTPAEISNLKKECDDNSEVLIFTTNGEMNV